VVTGIPQEGQPVHYMAKRIIITGGWEGGGGGGNRSTVMGYKNLIGEKKKFLKTKFLFRKITTSRPFRSKAILIRGFEALRKEIPRRVIQGDD